MFDTVIQLRAVTASSPFDRSFLMASPAEITQVEISSRSDLLGGKSYGAVGAYEWLEGAMPGTEHLASPHRVAFQLGLIGDWIPDDPITVGVQELMPEWVRFHGEQSGLPETLIAPAIAVATGGELPESECPGAR